MTFTSHQSIYCAVRSGRGCNLNSEIHVYYNKGMCSEEYIYNSKYSKQSTSTQTTLISMVNVTLQSTLLVTVAFVRFAEQQIISPHYFCFVFEKKKHIYVNSSLFDILQVKINAKTLGVVPSATLTLRDFTLYLKIFLLSFSKLLF